ncbi:hypothetical protein H0H81_007221 [Sphagnurus paluster]|uniref:Uncharacterized protein n=1 Tax=Sphagnurus paluster TaxID=117069 RepID=A0A9P7GM63_9AGAR|nr:hypothetical protein H0H81_007221 [Sphagnurus paluster]
MSTRRPHRSHKSTLSTPDQASAAAAAKQSAVRDALTAAGYKGEYTLSSAFNLAVQQHHAAHLQEIHIDIVVHRPSAALRTSLARVFFPVPAVVHASSGREYVLPVIPPEGSNIREKDYWILAEREGLYRPSSSIASGRSPGPYAPPFQLGPIPEDAAPPSFWSGLKCW